MFNLVSPRAGHRINRVCVKVSIQTTAWPLAFVRISEDYTPTETTCTVKSFRIWTATKVPLSQGLLFLSRGFFTGEGCGTLSAVRIRSGITSLVRKLCTSIPTSVALRTVSAPLERTGKRTAQLMPNSHLLVYEGAPHGLMFTHMQRLNADLISFLGS